MAKPEFEYLGNDRYFKYRYAEETPVNFSTLAESWESKKCASFYKILENYLKRSLNIKLIYDGQKVSSSDLSKLYTAPTFFNKANIIAHTVSSSFFHDQQENFSPSPVLETAKTIIVSAAPKRLVLTSMSFVNTDNPVVILTVSTVVLLSLLLVIYSIVTNKFKSIPTKKFVKKLAQETLEKVWENAALLCAEPIPIVLPHITCRLAASSWLIGVTFILIFLGCFLRTEFTTESYKSIDTISDLIQTGIPPTFIEGTGTFEYLKAIEDPIVKEWLHGLDQEKLFTTYIDYMRLEGYIRIHSGEKALIIEDSYMNWMMGEFLTSDSESKEFFVNQGGLYFSKSNLYFDYFHIIFNTSWLRSTPQMEENLKLSLQPFFESQSFKYIDFEVNHFIEQVKWRRPLKIPVQLDLSSVFVPFYWLFILLFGAVAVFVTEILFNQFA